ncbi:hypothetical protein EYR40_009670 [Pleurotus pulmonarius]|nr:hypothetical protein EYR38_009237 [Pleurotus pulmonarius]KAF4591070.1 hypothetical protein EYR40_009670 [Pleurotus pulmonarius]
MKRPIPRYSKASRKELPPPVASSKPPLPPPTSTNPLSAFARMNPETLARGMISYTEYIDKKMQRIESANPSAPPSHSHIPSAFDSNDDVTMTEASSSGSA